jgi:uncharacterized protein YbjQ (UPF0145 family)
VIPALTDTFVTTLLAGRADNTITLIELAFNLGLPLVLLTLGWLIGGRRERAHLRDLARREALNADVLRTDLRAYGPADARAGAMIVTSEVVIGADYCKVFLAGLRNLLGGNLRAYETLADRARREALLRLVEQARGHQFNALCCIRVESSNIGKGVMPMVAVLASATAYRTAAV